MQSRFPRLRRSSSSQRRWGEGPHKPAVDHGLGGNSLNWVDLSERLADQLECVSLDLPGFGSAEPLADADYSIAAHTAAVATIDALFPSGRCTCSATRWMGRSRCRWPRGARTWCARCAWSPRPDLRPHLTNIHIPVMALPRVGNARRWDDCPGHGMRSSARRRGCWPRTWTGALSGRGRWPARWRPRRCCGRAAGQAREPEGGAPGDQGVLGRARDGLSAPTEM